MGDFEPSQAFRLANRMVTPLIRMGLPMGVRRSPMALLTVPGRKSGLPRTTPVALASRGPGWLLVAVYGQCDWSRNLEAAGMGTVTHRGRVSEVAARRLPPAEGGPVLREQMRGAPAMVRRMTAAYFSAPLDAPSSAWEQEAVDHPVFELTPL